MTVASLRCYDIARFGNRVMPIQSPARLHIIFELDKIQQATNRVHTFGISSMGISHKQTSILCAFTSQTARFPAFYRVRLTPRPRPRAFPALPQHTPINLLHIPHCSKQAIYYSYSLQPN